MKRMRQFLIALLLVWTAACIAAYYYSHQQNIPLALAAALLPAFLTELALYLAPGFQAVRKHFDRLGSKAIRAGLLTASAGIPYALASISLHGFSFPALLLLVALAAFPSFWYVVLKRGPAADCFFLVFMGAAFLSRVFTWIYARPPADPHLQLETLGHLMWIRVGIMAVLSIRGFENIRFGFLPARSDWKIGVKLFLFFLPVAGVLAYALNYPHFHLLAVPWWQYIARIVLTFLGMLWVVALSEEFFFRGFLQQLASRELRSKTAGLVAASALFGLVHLPYRSFPNWRLAILAATLGVFCGIGFMRARSVRASMVTHALAATTFRLFMSP
jgi:membrane protease YdiL (CAAX protease family)